MKTICQVCMHHCALEPGKTGLCRARKNEGGDLETVKAFIARAQESCHVELTTLIVPGENDSALDMEAQAKWIAALRPTIPLHITRFFPRYHMRDREATDVEQLYRLAGIAKKYLQKVYVGNV
ncbi:MAG: hypothetical protein OSJ72_17750 [Lachnospiraceae bacterium]|nr:hypothetical protein [Lachnospiraceae bacterium]